MSVLMTLSNLERRKARGQIFQAKLLNNIHTVWRRTTKDGRITHVGWGRISRASFTPHYASQGAGAQRSPVCVVCAADEGISLAIGYRRSGSKSRKMELPGRERSVDDIFSRMDSVHLSVTNVTRRQQRLSFRIVSRSKKEFFVERGIKLVKELRICLHQKCGKIR